MKKLSMHSKDLTQDNLAKIQAAFPNCITESTDENGNIKLSVDFDLLRQELSDHIVEGPQERYRLDWPGKREAILLANAPIAKTLRPARDESVDFDNTENLFIEGDNLEALKLLQENYLGKVKMIYIDPPYNTGNDFVYKDNFAESSKEYFERSHQIDEEGNRLVTNTNSNGRFHSDWLSMMLPRLRLARNLLSDDGVIFISIDENEIINLKQACCEVFGETNFIENFIWIKKTAPNNVSIGTVHEYILVFSKNKDSVRFNLRKRTSEDNRNYKNPDNDPRGPWMADNITSPAKGGRMTKSLMYKVINPYNGEVHWPPKGRMWSITEPEMLKKIEEGTVVWGRNNNGRPMNKRFLSETRQGKVQASLLDDAGSNSQAARDIQKIFDGNVVFETPKPVSLIERLLYISANANDVILDFFAGSSTTAHAVMQLNAEDGGNRKFIMVQLPEEIGENHEAFKAGYKNIAEISKERIRRAGKQILEGECHEGWNKDVGFRVLKVDSSNMKDVYYSPQEISQEKLFNYVDNIKEDRTSEDLLFQVLLESAVELNVPIRRENIQGKEVYFVNDNDLIACFDNDITEELINELATHQPLRVVFRDGGFADNSVKTNVTQIFKQLSEGTEVRSI